MTGDEMERRANSFDNIRSWEGTQSRAFEELAFQLLKDTVPAGSRAIRTGNPDGGVEWYATLADGSEQGWQAKHTHTLDSLFSGMTDSVKRVAAERPTLRKLTFVISDNLSTGKVGKEKLSARTKYENQIASWQKTIPGADEIEFDLVGGSELLEILSQPMHRGREWFWWDKTVLDHDWLTRQFDRQAAAAGQKYRPDLQVDVPIQDDLAAVGFAEAPYRRLLRLLKAVTDAIDDLSMYPRGDADQLRLYEEIQKTSSALASGTRGLTLSAGDRADALDEIRTLAAACSNAIQVARDREFAHRRQRDQLERDDPAREKVGPTDIATGYAVGDIDTAVDRLLGWMDSHVGQALVRPRYFLTGVAGSGKTHVFLDAVHTALEENRPAVFLSGQEFGGGLWGSVAEQMGLPPRGSDELLGAMDAAGEAASQQGRRFVIFVDALNETSESDFWVRHLPALRSAVAQRPHVALVVSCRDTYLPVVAAEEERDEYVGRTHPGFAGNEDEAAAKFFAHYGLEAPRFPLLTPEFSVPLFLRVYCEALRDGAETSAGHETRTRIFERYVGAKVRAVARHLAPNARTGFEVDDARKRVESVLDRLIELFSVNSNEALTVTAAHEAAREVLDGDRALASRTLGALQAEAVLSQERVYTTGEGRVEGVRIVFQAFSDFLILRRRMRDVQDPLTDEAFLSWLREDASAGIVEAASVAFPEKFDRELLDVLDIDVSTLFKLDRAGDYDQRRELRRSVRAAESLLSTLKHRSASSVTQRTMDLVNEARVFIRSHDFFELIFTLAPQPNHRLNGDALHRHLADIAMPRRDRYFGFATYNAISDPETAGARLAKWAASGPYPDYDPNVIELAAIPLCWLLSSPNRYQRDWVTKALSQLLSGHLEIAARLVARFWTIDDPYVVQRVVLIAYGALLKANEPNSSSARELAQTVLDTVYARPVRPDAVLLDAARSLVRLAVVRGLLDESAYATTEAPLGIKPPRANPPTYESLKSRYGKWEDVPREASWYSVFGSIFGMGDFGKYVVASAAHDYTSTPLGQPHPPVTPRPARKIAKAVWTPFIDSLDDEQRALVATVEQRSMLALLRIQRRLALSPEQRELFPSSPVPSEGAKSRRDTKADRAERWVMARTVSLGWTPEVFAERDGEIARWRSGREAHKAERWGKKYQWIALHEYVARMADNFRPKYEEHRVDFRTRDIDVSLPPVPYAVFSAESDEDTEADQDPQASDPPPHSLVHWPGPPVDFRRYGGSIHAFVEDTASEPQLEDLVRVHDVHGDEWLVLGGDLTQVDPRAVKRWRGIRQSGSSSSWLVPAGTGKHLCSVLDSVTRFDLFDFDEGGDHANCCYVREVGIVDRGCGHQRASLEEYEIHGRRVSAASSVEGYSWSANSLDCSIDSAAVALAPSTYLQSVSALRFSPAGPSWVNGDGKAVFQHYPSDEHPARALLVRASHLASVLGAQKLELVVSSSVERMNLDHGMGASDREPFVTLRQVAWLDASLRFRTRPPRRATDVVDVGE